MSSIILFTNRSGSTLLCDIIAYNDRSVNLGEGLHSLARDYNYNAPGNQSTGLYKEFSIKSLTAQFHNPQTRGSDHIGYFKAKAARLELLKNPALNWTAKENLEKQTYDVSFTDYCVANGIDIYLTHRRNIIAQFISKVNARYRLEVANLGKNNESQFIYTNDSAVHHYNEMKIKFSWLYLYVNVFLEQLMMWRIAYERYKHVAKIVSYEDQIKPMNFTAIGIEDKVVEQYKMESQHLIPTPHNAKEVVVLDDHPRPIAGAWEQALFYINKHKYLVEI